MSRTTEKISPASRSNALADSTQRQLPSEWRIRQRNGVALRPSRRRSACWAPTASWSAGCTRSQYERVRNSSGARPTRSDAAWLTRRIRPSMVVTTSASGATSNRRCSRAPSRMYASRLMTSATITRVPATPSGQMRPTSGDRADTRRSGRYGCDPPMHDLAPGSQNTPTGAAPVSVHFVNNVLAAAASYIEVEPDTARDVLADLGAFLSHRLRPARVIPLSPGARPRRPSTCASSRRVSPAASRPSCRERRPPRPSASRATSRRRWPTRSAAASASAPAACASPCAPAWTARAGGQLDGPAIPAGTPSASASRSARRSRGARHERDDTASPSSRSTTSRGRWRTSSTCSRPPHRSTASRRRRARRRRSSTSGGRYDALFLDVHMPEIEGMALARLLRRFADPPAVVFVTGHPDAAVEAFEIQALDFLVKPVSRERLESALGRVEAQSRPAPSAPAPVGRRGGGDHRLGRPGRRRGRQPQGRRQAARPPRDDLDRPGQRRLRAHRLRRRALPAADAAEPAREGVVAERLRAGPPGVPRQPRRTPSSCARSSTARPC